MNTTWTSMNSFWLIPFRQSTDSAQRFEAITDIYLGMPEIFVEPESVTKLSEVLASLVALEAVFLQYEGEPGMATGVEIVRHMRQIRKLSLLRKERTGPDPGTGC
jgi:hypothetical protein